MKDSWISLENFQHANSKWGVKNMETAAKLWVAAQASSDLAEELFSDKTSHGLCVWGWWWWWRASLPCSSSSSCHCCFCCCTSRQNTRQAAGPTLKLQTVLNINPKLVYKMQEKIARSPTTPTHFWTWVWSWAQKTYLFTFSIKSRS